MPKYTFICECGWSGQQYSSISTKEIVCPICAKSAEKQLPSLSGPSNVTEVIDKYTGTTWRLEQREEVKQRRDEYYWSVEVPRLVASGTYSIETMLENNWITVDDHGHIAVNTTPPHKR